MTICKDTEMIGDNACRSLVQNPLRFSSSFCLLPGPFNEIRQIKKYKFTVKTNRGINCH